MQANENQTTNKPAKTVSSTTPVRVKLETRKKLNQMLAKINKKDFGKRVRPDQLMALALSLVEAHHIAKLQDESLSNIDRLEARYQDYIKKHGRINKDTFIGKLLSGEINSTLPRDGDSTELGKV